MPSFLRHIRGPYLGVLMLLVSITSTQLGTSEAKFLMRKVGPEVTVALRLACATLLLFIALRPWRHLPRREEWKSVLVYGVAIAFMNGCFYQAIARIPQGLAVAVEFSGPLIVAVCSSRRWTDYAGVALAVAGLLLILPWSGLDSGLDLTGFAFALAAAAGWAGYIVFGRRAGGGGVCAAAWGMLAGTLVAVPWAVMADGLLLFRPDVIADVLPLAFAVGFLASALPYGLEIVALRIVPPQAYGVLMSLEPAAAALFGFLILGEVLSARQWCALALVIAASLLVMRKAKDA
ncbi:EamA family transporter [uncultured Mailhella sp.]|uniref:EamA family transporter n=1 Tax=uncultured Mailhella sp. TaxID=1981031 RepID=UPI0025EAF792|nr:EamA family transporter [uncultured Mailhella sp.]